MTKLPDGWELKRLSDCLEKLKSGKKAERGWSPQCLSHPSSDENVWGVLKTTSVQMGEFQPEYNKELPDSLTPKSGLEVNSGDFLITTTGPRNRCGIVCHVKKTRKKLIFSGKILRFRVNESLILPNWLMYLLMSPEYQSILDKMKVGTSDSSVSIGNQQILDLEIPVPTIDEQHKIVEILEDRLSRLDAALADVKQAKIKAAQFRRSLLQASFTGYFSNESFTFGSEIPPSWRKISLGNLLVPRKQKDIPSTFPNLPYIGMEHVARDVGVINSFGSSADYRSAAPRVYEGDVLYGRLRPYLNKVVITPCEAFASGEFIVLPPNEKISGKFLQLRLLSQDFVEFAGTLDTGDRPRVSWEQISRFELALPTIDEQLKMISSLEDHLSRLDASVSIADAMEKQSNGLRRSLLQAAFTGQLTNEVVSV